MQQARVLVIDDEPAILDNTVYALKSEGFAVTSAQTARDGLAAFSRETPDLVVLDVGLPDGSGFEVCREIRRIAPVPVIFLTARSGEMDRVVGLEIGADDYVVKPFSPRELAARVKAVLRRCAPAAAPPGAAAAAPAAAQSASSAPGNPLFQVDEERARIRCAGHTLELSATEFRILRTLCRHPGRVFSRSQLMDEAWDDPAASMERTVDAHIRSLRAHIRTALPAEADDPICTHRGLGYSLREEC